MDGEEVTAGGQERRYQTGKTGGSDRRMAAFAVFSLALAFFLPLLRFSEIRTAVRSNRAILLSLKDEGHGDLSVSHHFEAVDDRSAASVSALVGLGRWQLWKNSPDNAVVTLRKAVGLAPRDRQANLFLGRALTEVNLLEEAVEAFRRAGLSNGAGDFNFLTHTAWTNLEVARSAGPQAPEWKRAERYYQVTRLLFRDDWRHWRNAVDFYLYYRLDEDQGMAVLKHAEVAFPESIVPYLEEARYFAYRRRKSELLSVLRRAAAKKPNDRAIDQFSHEVLRGDPRLQGPEWVLLADEMIRARLAEPQKAVDPVNRKGPRE